MCLTTVACKTDFQSVVMGWYIENSTEFKAVLIRK